MRSTMLDTPLTVPHFFHRAEQYFGDREVITATPTRTVRTTYGRWSSRVRRLAGALSDLGVGAHSTVGFFGWNTSDHLETYFAAVGTGRVFHSINSRLPAEHVAYTIRHAQDEIIVVQNALLARLRAALDDHPAAPRVVVVADPDDDTRDPDVIDYDDLISAACPLDLTVTDELLPASICYTGGTTGLPKGVVYSQRSLYLHTMSLLQRDNIGISESDVVLPLVPMAHANGWGLPQAAVAAGATLVLPGPDSSGHALAELITSERVSVSAAVPTVWARVLPELAGKDVGSIRELCSGGSAASSRLMELARQVTGRPLLQVWGMTETGAFAAIARERTGPDNRNTARTASVRRSQGLPVAGIEIRVVEPDSLCPVPWDATTIGEVQCSGPSVIASYHDDPRGDDSFTSDGWLRTGDMAVLDSEGYLWLGDRTKDVIKSGGEWISSVEVEHALLAHPAVESAAVVGVASEEWGERPIAYVTLRGGHPLDTEAVLEFLRGRLAKFWVPDSIHVIDELPTTAVGKIDKKLLRDRQARV